MTLIAMNRAIIIAFAIALSGCDPGGVVTTYADRAQTRTGPLPMDCRSACVMYLLRGCVTPGHRLTFHRPTPDTVHWRGVIAGARARLRPHGSVGASFWG